MVRHEVIPVVGDLEKPETYQDAVDKSAYVIDTVFASFTAEDLFRPNKELLESVAKVLGQESSAQNLHLHIGSARVYSQRGSA